jgi:protein-L-isoaspartate O-methyltransferase
MDAMKAMGDTDRANYVPNKRHAYDDSPQLGL